MGWRTAEQAIEILVAEGHARDDVLAAIDSLILAGLSLEQLDRLLVLIDDADLDVLREQLSTPVDSD